MVFLGRWILDVGSLDELDSKDKFRFSGSVSSGVVFFQDAFGLQFRISPIGLLEKFSPIVLKV